MGRHLLFTNWRVTSSEAILPTLPKIAFTDRLNERLAFVTEHLNSLSRDGKMLRLSPGIKISILSKSGHNIIICSVNHRYLLTIMYYSYEINIAHIQFAVR